MRILIADDHPIARRGLRMIISEAFGDAECVEAADTAAALTLAVALRPDLVLVDMHMPGDVTVPALCRMIRAELADSKIVIVTAFDTTNEIRDCLIAGADGCLLKDTSETDMAAALRTAVAGTPALDPRVAFRLAYGLQVGSDDEDVPHLSGREQDVLRLLAEGRSNRVIARRLGLSEATVKGHVSRVLDKLNASSRLEAVVRAIGSDLI